MYRTHTCGELRLSDVGKNVELCGWVQRSRELGGMTFVDLRDRYGITQLAFNMATNADLCATARTLGREFVVQANGKVIERSSKNKNIGTGEIEIEVNSFAILNESITPPFTIEDESDGGDELRMKYRYLDLRRNPVKNALVLRHQMAQQVRRYLSDNDFLEIETPFLIKSTPEGARDFVVPSRIHHGEFYALPQSPQQFKQLLMVAGYDRYFQIVKCFRDEDLRADRQPEFTQVDCEMAFVHRDDVLNTFEGLTKHILKTVKGVDYKGDFPKMQYAEAMEFYGSDKPDIRFDMKFIEVTILCKGKSFGVFDAAEYIGGIVASGCSEYTRKQTDELTDFVKKPQIGAQGLIYIKYNLDDTLKSSVDKFFTPEELKKIADSMGAKPGDLIFLMAGSKKNTLKQLCELRLEMGSRLGLRNKDVFAPLWVVDFPLYEYDEQLNRYFAMHHPFTSPIPEHVGKFDTNPAEMLANAYDLVINGVELGGGSVRIFDRTIQQKMFKTLGFSAEEAQKQFGFLMDAFQFGAPPHAGIAFGLDRWVSLMAGHDSIRDVIAFPKNNSARDVMINSPDTISEDQLKELGINIAEPIKK